MAQRGIRDGVRMYTVETDIYHLRLPDPLSQGYESERALRSALRALSERWMGRVGEPVAERNGFLLLRFHDTPGGRPDEAWLPSYLLREVEPGPPGPHGGEADDAVRAFEECFGFD